MLYLLYRYFEDALEDTTFSFLRVLTFETFQAAMAVLVSFLICLLAGPRTIAWLRHKKIGDQPDFDQADINALMAGKKDTPTMGGVLIITAIAASILLLADLSNFYVVLGLLALLLLGGIGVVDDWLKLTAAQRQGGRQGLYTREKLAFQVGITVILAVFTWYYGQQLDQANRLYLPFVKPAIFAGGWDMGLNVVGFVVIATFVIVGSTNAVNLTDGLDGLAAGCMAIVAFVFLAIALVVSDAQLANGLLFHHIKPAGQMAVIAGAMMGACLGFLWFNCSPARVFMGDTGSLALGGLIGYVAIVLRQELLLVLAGGIFVAEAMSVLMQVGYFKYTRKRYGEGRRIFRMAPLHHHFQKLGWTETQVVVRFWLIGVMLAAMSLATLKLR